MSIVSGQSYRGAFDPAEDSDEWKLAVVNFPNGVPKFETKIEAEEFARRQVLILNSLFRFIS